MEAEISRIRARRKVGMNEVRADTLEESFGPGPENGRCGGSGDPPFGTAKLAFGTIKVVERFVCSGTLLSLLLFSVAPSFALLLPGGGSKATDCVAVFDAPQANFPSAPRTPKMVRCSDGDPSCDTDGSRNGECVFDIGLCVNSTALSTCTPSFVDSVFVEHSVDNGDRRFDPDFQALQQRIDLLGFPDNIDVDSCVSALSSVTVRLRGPKRNSRMVRSKKKLIVTATGRASGRTTRDKDKLLFLCEPEGDGIYLPRDLYTGTFDRIRQQVFAQSCALSGCHDSESQAGALVLLPNAAHSNLVDVLPANVAARVDGLLRVDGVGDPASSLLYRKVTGDLAPGYGSQMPLGTRPLSASLVEIIRLWIIGDALNGPAPAGGWVPGTDG